MTFGAVLELTQRPKSSLVTVSGELDLAGYGSLRDGLLEAAADSPPRLVADVNALLIGELSPATVFPLVARRVEEWPGVPFAVVTRQPRHLAAFRAPGLSAYRQRDDPRAGVRAGTRRAVGCSGTDRRRLLTVAVADDSDRPAVLLDRADARDPGLGLRIVADAARAWGSRRRWSGGKIVWAAITSGAHDGQTTL